ncbi:MAG: Hsp20/alpha crystallin family protein [Planctomycetes bacterium]|nr:Hsp20/alpha crystallin family protein [Planctomycetota bacterium]
MNEHEDRWDHMRRQLREMADRLDRTVRKMPGIGRFMPGQYPLVNVYEGSGEVVVCAAVPGVSKDDVEVNLSGGILTVRGKEAPAGYKDYTCHLKEHEAGEFCREIPLPARVDEEAEAVATLQDGVLTVRLKIEPERPGKSIDVTSG